MKNFKHIAVVLTFLLAIAFLPIGHTIAQGDFIGRISAAFKVGSAKDLARNFNSVVEITMDGGNATSYSSTQAEFVMKNFFSKYPPVECSVGHKGSSDGGQRYVILAYTSKAASNTVLVRFKEEDGRAQIYSINFIKD
ncbi:DUF4783 domain-containing protein [Pontibacter beigongshangensis]|uniref:DUF4783 domain-containing protein n=1 Tax=Pontibacter beigongshangensis TaxID=2574733 RepID=UPI00164F4DBC|nr:DUF4783 domain-containing protein [Pontibacter beigongshangensis]